MLEREKRMEGEKEGWRYMERKELGRERRFEGQRERKTDGGRGGKGRDEKEKSV